MIRNVKKYSGSTIKQNREDEQVEIEEDEIEDDQGEANSQHSIEKRMDEIEIEDKEVLIGFITIILVTTFYPFF